MLENNTNELLTRGVENIYPSKEFVETKIKKGEKLTIYLGIDPTGPTLHLGHAIALKKLGEFQKAGHKIIMLLGDFTAMIGDPTDKKATRIPLTRKQILINLKNYKKQASKLLNFTGKNPAKIMFNSKWHDKMKQGETLSLASHMTVSQMLERDMFKRRNEEGKPILIHEFMYPLLQGYDSVAMDVDGEIGGNDQTFNMLVGRNLMKTLKNKEKFVLTVKILEDSDGKKMGKTEGNMVALSDSAEEMYGKIMSWTDNLILPGFELCTDVSTIEIENMAKDLIKGINPKDLKMRLAKEIVTIYHGDKKAEQAKTNWEKTFSSGEIPKDAPIAIANKNTLLVDVLLQNKIISSKTEFRRLVDEHAITNLKTNEKITDYNVNAKSGTYRIGKKRFIEIKEK